MRRQLESARADGSLGRVLSSGVVDHAMAKWPLSAIANVLHGHLRPQLPMADMPDDETKKTGQKIRPEFVEVCFVEHVGIQCRGEETMGHRWPCRQRVVRLHDYAALTSMVALRVSGTPLRREKTPMTERACSPSGPKTSTIRSEAPSRTFA